MSFSQKRADALASLAERFVATATVDDENSGIQALARHHFMMPGVNAHKA